MGLEAMAMKRYSAFSKASASLEPNHQIVGVSCSSEEMQSIYSTAPACWGILGRVKKRGGTRNQRKNLIYPDYNIFYIDVNSSKCPGNLRELPVTQTAVNDAYLKKTHKELNNYYFYLSYALRVRHTSFNLSFITEV